MGKNKKEAVKIYGKDQVKSWRRAYDDPPPPMKDDHEFHPARDPRYRHVSKITPVVAECQTMHDINVAYFHFVIVCFNFLQMLDLIPKSESLKDTVERSSVYWDEVLAPSLKNGKTILIVGHENNLRSLIMRLEDIAPEDMINLNLPRAVPLAYRLDENLKPLDRPDGKLDEATGYLRGEWIGGDEAVRGILARDYKQVYDTQVTQNLEVGKDREKFNNWMELLIGGPSPEASAKGDGSHAKQQQVNGLKKQQQQQQHQSGTTSQQAA